MVNFLNKVGFFYKFILAIFVFVFFIIRSLFFYNVVCLVLLIFINLFSEYLLNMWYMSDIGLGVEDVMIS